MIGKVYSIQSDRATRNNPSLLACPRAMMGVLNCVSMFPEASTAMIPPESTGKVLAMA
jgi:hypothetical protein